MSELEPEEGGLRFAVNVPPELSKGVYSNFLTVWNSPYEFTLDFSVSQVPEPLDPDDPDAGLVVPCETVARVKMPVTLIFNVLQALNDAMTGYEQTFGEIKRPEQEAEE